MKPNVKKYLFPTIAVVALLVGFLIGNAVSNKVNAQRFFIQNGQGYADSEDGACKYTGCAGIQDSGFKETHRRWNI